MTTDRVQLILLCGQLTACLPAFKLVNKHLIVNGSPPICIKTFHIYLKKLIRITFSEFVHDESEPSCAGMQHILEVRQVVLGSKYIAFCPGIFCKRRHTHSESVDNEVTMNPCVWLFITFEKNSTSEHVN